MAILNRYKNKIQKLGEGQIQRRYKRAHKRIIKYEQRLERVRGESGIGLLRFLIRNHKKEEKIETRLVQKLNITKAKIKILEDVAELKEYELPKYFIQHQSPLPMSYLSQKFHDFLYPKTS